MHVKTYPAFLTPRDKKLSLSSSEEKSSKFGWLEIKRNEKWKRRKKQSKALYILYIDRYYIYLTCPLLQWMQESLYRKVIYPSLDTSYLRNYMSGWIQGENGNLYKNIWRKISKRVGGKYREALRTILQEKMVSARFRRHSRGLRNIFATTS